MGRASAIALAAAGWSLALFARRVEMLEETKALCADPSRVLLVAGDVTSEADVKRLFDSTISTYGTVQANGFISSPSALLRSRLPVLTILASSVPGRLDMLFNVRVRFLNPPSVKFYLGNSCVCTPWLLTAFNETPDACQCMHLQAFQIGSVNVPLRDCSSH